MQDINKTFVTKYFKYTHTKTQSSLIKNSIYERIIVTKEVGHESGLIEDMTVCALVKLDNGKWTYMLSETMLEDFLSPMLTEEELTDILEMLKDLNRGAIFI